MNVVTIVHGSKNKTPNIPKNDRFEVLTKLRMTGLEPARGNHQNLNLARLPIPPHPRVFRTRIIISHNSESVKSNFYYI